MIMLIYSKLVSVRRRVVAVYWRPMRDLPHRQALALISKCYDNPYTAGCENSAYTPEPSRRLRRTACKWDADVAMQLNGCYTRAV